MSHAKAHHPFIYVQASVLSLSGLQPHRPEVSEFWDVLSDRRGIAAEALRYKAFTAVRTGSIRKAKWPEIDFAKAIWTIPEDHVKGDNEKRKEFRVPLPDEALALLRRLPRLSEYIFPGQRSPMLSENTLERS